MSYITKLFQPEYWKKGIKFIRHFGFKEALAHFQYGVPKDGERYHEWLIRHRVTEDQLAEQRQHAFLINPRISVVIPLYNTRQDFLTALLDSFQSQSYSKWELCLADGSTEDAVGEQIKAYAEAHPEIRLIEMTGSEADTSTAHSDAKRGASTTKSNVNTDSSAVRSDAKTVAPAIGTVPMAASAPAAVAGPVIRYRRLTENTGISGNTNAAIAMTTGDYILFCDHDDYVEPDALYEIVRRINDKPETDIVYTDEDLCDEKGTRFESPRFKPDFNPDFLTCINYICHIFLVKKAILDKVGGLDSAYDGAQDWDLILRCTEKTDKIEHIAKPLYHWRAHEASTAGNQDSKTYAIDAGRRAVLAHFERIGQEATLHYTGIFVLFRPILKVAGNPKVSIIIPNKDQAKTLETCVESIETKSTWKNYEIIIVENNSTESKTFQFYDHLLQKYDNIKVVTFEGAFNYSKVNNFGAKSAEGDYILLLNNDTEVITPDWMEQMLGFCQRDNTGAVGAKLLYPDNTVQHCGVVIGIGGFAGHILTWEERENSGYFGRVQAVQDISAVTAACMMVKKTVWDEVNGFNEDYAVALNDIDLCLRIREKGHLIVLNPGAELYHYESKSRGSEEESPEKHERFKSEIRRFRRDWADILEEGDPYYSPNLTLKYGDCRIKEPNEHFMIIDEINREDKAQRDQEAQ